MKKKLLFLMLCMMPMMVFAESGGFGSLTTALAIEAFISIHMSAFVLKPLSEIIKPDDSKNMFIKLFVIRVVILLIFDFFITYYIFIFDFLFVFVGTFIIIPMLTAKNRNKIVTLGSTTNTNSMDTTPVINDKKQDVKMTCKSCGNVIPITNKFCTNCGTPVSNENVTVEYANNENEPFTSFNPDDYDAILKLNEKEMINEFINRAMVKCNFDKGTNYIPKGMVKRKVIMSLIFSLLLGLFIALIFFHFPIYTYLIGVAILIILFIDTTKYNFMSYMTKVIKERPSEKITNIVMSVKENLVKDYTKIIFIVTSIIAVILPLFIFKDPVIIYEKNETGYSVRFYAFGLSNFTSATIPEQYKGKDVTSLRGNTFSNMFFLKEVTLPDTITEIRGQAFRNDFNLTDVNIPKNLEYLGGGAFYKCSSIKNIELPDTLTYMGGETFYKASSLESIKLSKNLEEIRGNSFEECISLKEIEIPDSVTRIGGHAFYGNSSLRSVKFTENSKLEEIGSSAFRMCGLLTEIEIPRGVIINERAFKESPTKITYFGDIKYGKLVDSSKYDKDTFLYIKEGEQAYVNQFFSDREETYLTYIKFLNSKKVNGKGVFYLEYVDKDNEVTSFVLNIDKPYYVINENVAVEISSTYAFDRTDTVSINVYYN